MGGCERHPFGVIHTAFLTYRLLPCIRYRTQAWNMTRCANVKLSKFYATGLDTSNGTGYGRLARWAGEETARGHAGEGRVPDHVLRQATQMIAIGTIDIT
jgi:hypothetical protein